MGILGIWGFGGFCWISSFGLGRRYWCIIMYSDLIALSGLRSSPRPIQPCPILTSGVCHFFVSRLMYKESVAGPRESEEGFALVSPCVFYFSFFLPFYFFFSPSRTRDSIVAHTATCIAAGSTVSLPGDDGCTLRRIPPRFNSPDGVIARWGVPQPPVMQ